MIRSLAISALIFAGAPTLGAEPALAPHPPGKKMQPAKDEAKADSDHRDH